MAFLHPRAPFATSFGIGLCGIGRLFACRNAQLILLGLVLQQGVGVTNLKGVVEVDRVLFTVQ